MNRHGKIYLSLGVIGVFWMLSPLLLHVLYTHSTSETVFATIIAICTGGLIWLIRGSLKSGENIWGDYFVDSSRAGNPPLFWFSIVVAALVALMGAVISVVAFWRAI